MLWVLLPFLVKQQPIGRGFEKLEVSLCPQSENLQPPTLGIWNHPITTESPKLPIGCFCTATMSAVPKAAEGSGGAVMPGAQACSDPPIEMSGSWNVSEAQDDAAAMRCIVG